MLGRQFLVVDGDVLPETVAFTYSLDPVENVNKSEAGTDVVSSTRLDKHVFDAEWQVSSIWLDKLESYCKKKTVMLQYRGTSYKCRARGFAPELVEGSARINKTNGLWRVKLTFYQI